MQAVWLKWNNKLKNAFLAYRHLQNSGLSQPQEQITYDAFYMFCLDFGLAANGLTPKQIKQTMVYVKCGLEKGDLERNPQGAVTHVNFNMLDFSHFRESLFVMAYYKNFDWQKITDLDYDDLDKSVGNLDAFSFEKFLEKLQLDDNFSKMLRRVANIQEKKKPREKNYLEDSIKFIKSRPDLESEARQTQKRIKLIKI